MLLRWLLTLPLVAATWTLRSTRYWNTASLLQLASSRDTLCSSRNSTLFTWPQSVQSQCANQGHDTYLYIVLITQGFVQICDSRPTSPGVTFSGLPPHL